MGFRRSDIQNFRAKSMTSSQGLFFMMDRNLHPDRTESAFYQQNPKFSEQKPTSQQEPVVLSPEVGHFESCHKCKTCCLLPPSECLSLTIPQRKVPEPRSEHRCCAVFSSCAAERRTSVCPWARAWGWEEAAAGPGDYRCYMFTQHDSDKL